MGENLKRGYVKKYDFVFDTSAFISLGCINILEEVLDYFSVVTTLSVLRELDEFSKYDDSLGLVANRVLKSKWRWNNVNSEVDEIIKFVSKTDQELFNLALSNGIPLVSDDTKLAYHAKGKIECLFSTVFLSIFVESDVMTRDEALEKLEKMRYIRNWQSNAIYLFTKQLLDSNL